MTILQCLRVYGPCSNVEIARRVGRGREDVYSAVYRLRGKGLVDRLGPGSYGLTDAGRAAFEREAGIARSEPVSATENQGLMRWEM